MTHLAGRRPLVAHPGLQTLKWVALMEPLPPLLLPDLQNRGFRKRDSDGVSQELHHMVKERSIGQLLGKDFVECKFRPVKLLLCHLGPSYDHLLVLTMEVKRSCSCD